MSLLSVSFPDVTVPPSCTRCIASSLLSNPYIFYQSLTMLTTCIIAQCIAASTSCSCLFKTLHVIKSFFGILQAITPSHHSFNPPPNLSSGTFDIQIHLTRLEVSFCPDQLQPDYFETVVKKSKTDPFWETAKLTIAKSNSPVCAVYYCIKRLLPDKYTSSCSVSVPVLRL